MNIRLSLLPLLLIASLSAKDNGQKYYIKAEQLADIGKYQEALVYIDKAIACDPDSFTLWGERGAINYAAGNYSAAIIDLTRAASLNKTCSTVYKIRAKCYFALNNLIQARADLFYACSLGDQDAINFAKASGF